MKENIKLRSIIPEIIQKNIFIYFFDFQSRKDNIILHIE
jgi:hypothetical protein